MVTKVLDFFLWCLCGPWYLGSFVDVHTLATVSAY